MVLEIDQGQVEGELSQLLLRRCRVAGKMPSVCAEACFDVRGFVRKPCTTLVDVQVSTLSSPAHCSVLEFVQVECWRFSVSSSLRSQGLYQNPRDAHVTLIGGTSAALIERRATILPCPSRAGLLHFCG